MTTNKVLIDLPKEEVCMFFDKHNAYTNAIEKDRASKLFELLKYSYSKCGYKLTKALIDKYCIEDELAKLLIMAGVVKNQL